MTRTKLAVKDMMLVPHDQCTRTKDHVIWPGAWLEKAIARAEDEGLSLILLHGHPGGYLSFSHVDDESDRETMRALRSAIPGCHGSAIMTPDGAMCARIYEGDDAIDCELVMVAGDDIRLWWSDQRRTASGRARPLAFTADMTRELKRLSVFVIGMSGTGSIGGEAVGRLGFGEIGAVDFDRVEMKNLNRILNSTVGHAAGKQLKVMMFKAAVALYRPDACVVPIPTTINVREAVLAASMADVILCCVDSEEGRQVCDWLASAFCIPLIDMGVQIPIYDLVRGEIGDVLGRVDYIQPGGSTLADRRVYTPESLAAEQLREMAPDQHAQQLEEGYFKGRLEEAPAVIALNMRAAAAAVMEFIARAYPFRHRPNRHFARTIFSLASAEEDYFSEDEFDRAANPLLGRGAQEPLLGLPSLGASA